MRAKFSASQFTFNTFAFRFEYVISIYVIPYVPLFFSFLLARTKFLKLLALVIDITIIETANLSINTNSEALIIVGSMINDYCAFRASLTSDINA